LSSRVIAWDIGASLSAYMGTVATESCADQRVTPIVFEKDVFVGRRAAQCRRRFKVSFPGETL
jgi:hypothetical protein